MEKWFEIMDYHMEDCDIRRNLQYDFIRLNNKEVTDPKDLLLIWERLTRDLLRSKKNHDLHVEMQKAFQHKKDSAYVLEEIKKLCTDERRIKVEELK